MLFSGLPFLFYFLPLTLLLYFLTPKRGKNFVLLAASLFFYAWGEPKFIVFMLFSILAGYCSGLLLEKNRAYPVRAKWILTLSVAVSLALLGYCKYTDFFLSTIGALTGRNIPLLGVVLPIGISFYTFQILSYEVDVYRGSVAAQRNPIDLAAYIALFPQLIAGPIVRYADIAKELEDRTHTLDGITSGTVRFLIGLSKKILIANVLYELITTYKATASPSVLFSWLYAIACMLHIYFDFSGYSDMAIGLGRILGFSFPENFNYPYISASVTEFWRRWHMTLGSFFRDYVYIPLGGNRVATWKWIRNIIVVWMLTGLWHGAAWNFVLWGVYFAVFLLFEKLWFHKILDKSRVLRHVYVLLVIAVSFVLFDADSVTAGFSQIGALFGIGATALVDPIGLYNLRSYAVILIAAIIGATPLPKMIVGRMTESRTWSRVLAIVQPVVMLGLCVLSTAYLVDGSFNPFLYFRF